jgi:hypothetical protein
MLLQHLSAFFFKMEIAIICYVADLTPDGCHSSNGQQINAGGCGG